jgi:tetratricopeptide (TPR) repeat protein
MMLRQHWKTYSVSTFTSQHQSTTINTSGVEYWRKELQQTGADSTFFNLRREVTTTGRTPNGTFVCELIESQSAETYKAIRIFEWYMQSLRSRPSSFGIPEYEVNNSITKALTVLLQQMMKNVDEGIDNIDMRQVVDVLIKYTDSPYFAHVPDSIYTRLIQHYTLKHDMNVANMLFNNWIDRRSIQFDMTAVEKMIDEICNTNNNELRSIQDRRVLVQSALVFIETLLQRTKLNLSENLAKSLISGLVFNRLSEDALDFVLEYTYDKDKSVQIDFITTNLKNEMSKDVISLINKPERTVYVDHLFQIYQALCEHFVGVNDIKECLYLFVNIYKILNETNKVKSMYERVFAITVNEENQMIAYNLLDIYTENGMMQLAQSIYDKVRWKDDSALWLLINGYARISELSKAIKAMQQIFEKNRYFSLTEAQIRAVTTVFIEIGKRGDFQSFNRLWKQINDNQTRLSLPETNISLIINAILKIPDLDFQFNNAKITNGEEKRLDVVLKFIQIVKFDYSTTITGLIHMTVMNACISMNQPLNALNVLLSMIRGSSMSLNHNASIDALLGKIKQTNLGNRLWISNVIFNTMTEAILQYYRNDPFTAILMFIDVYQELVVEQKVWQPNNTLHSIVKHFLEQTLPAKDYELLRQKIIFSLKYESKSTKTIIESTVKQYQTSKSNL